MCKLRQYACCLLWALAFLWVGGAATAQFCAGTPCPQTRSMYWGAGALSPDGTNCAAPAEFDFTPGPLQYTIICLDNDNSIFHGCTTMPDGWNGTPPTFEIIFVQTANEQNIVNADISASCCDVTDVLATAFGAEQALDNATITGNGSVDTITSAAVTPSGTCNGGDMLCFEFALDAATTTTVATLHFLGVKMEYQWVPFD